MPDGAASRLPPTRARGGIIVRGPRHSARGGSLGSAPFGRSARDGMGVVGLQQCVNPERSERSRRIPHAAHADIRLRPKSLAACSAEAKHKEDCPSTLWRSTQACHLGWVESLPLFSHVTSKEAHMIVAIDGPAGSGKSTVAHAIAERCHLTYLDTGAMYRAVTWLCLQAGNRPRRHRRRHTHSRVGHHRVWPG